MMKLARSSEIESLGRISLSEIPELNAEAVTLKNGHLICCYCNH